MVWVAGDVIARLAVTDFSKKMAGSGVEKQAAAR
jgi:hypothetical protein